MTRNIYIVPNPDGTDPATYTNILIYRADDNGAGAPGAFSLITTTPIVTFEERTEYLDSGGALTSWYHYQYQTADTLTSSDLSPDTQLGDYLVRQWIKLDITDADINNTKQWDIWRDQTFLDMQADGLGRPAPVQDFAPSSETDATVQLRSDIRRVDTVELWQTTPLAYWTWIKNWRQRGRELRIYFPRTSYTYKIYGLADIRSLYDVDDELFMVLYWGMRWRYMLFRQHERVDFRPFLARTRQSDTTTQMDFKRLADDAKLQYDSTVLKLLTSEGVSSGGYS